MVESISRPPKPLHAGIMSIPNGMHNNGAGPQPIAQDVGHPSQENGSLGPGGLLYGYPPTPAPLPYMGPAHYPPYYPPHPQPFLQGRATGDYHHHPRGPYRSMNYPPNPSMPPYQEYPDPPHYMTQQYHHHQLLRHLYQPMMYPPHQQQQPQYPGDLFPMSLDGDGNARQYSTAAAVGPPIDWPVHAPVPEERREQGKSHLPLIRYSIWLFIRLVS